MNTPLITFPAPLLRLILCGGKGLAPAWGPLMGRSYDGQSSAWCGDRLWRAIPHGPETVVQAWSTEDSLSLWSDLKMPLDAESPWPARLALVAAFMLNRLVKGAPELSVIDVDADVLFLNGIFGMVGWYIATGASDPDLCLYAAPDLPTLPQHLQTHLPEGVALVLALWDVPEIRARIEAT